ncbi:PSME3-interacting protein-like [Acropora millepora]|uniref:PSME3-interacting protein-like n=1 Tax=Acropora millepora TaxID=45264 RepID=UPI001CF40B5E|nr:PSME3-interacting protein-like [Acropora millepora]
MSGVSFVSEVELDEIRERRQQEWEKVRKEDDPIECPDQVFDNKTLYERLQEQKQKKQDEWEEQHQLKNLIRGLDGDETVFLDLVTKQQEEIANRRFNEESQELREYRDAVSQFQSAISVPSDSKPPGSAVSQRKLSQESGTKKSQLQLITGAIKRKSNSEKMLQEKRLKVCEKNETNPNELTEDKEKGKELDKEASQQTNNTSSNEDGTTIRSHKNRTDSNQLQEKTASLCIPGICVYSDSSDSDASTS